MAPMIRNTRYQVDFVLREVCTDGSIAEDDLRFIRFGELVTAHGLQDFFRRSGHAMGTMFQPTGQLALSLSFAGHDKIKVIKLIRALTNLGLRDAKDLMEARLGTTIMAFNDMDTANAALEKFKECGATAELRTYDPSNEVRPNLHAVVVVGDV